MRALSETTDAAGRGRKVERNRRTGYVRLYRSLLSSPIFDDPNLLKLWAYCMLRASHRPRSIRITTGRGTSTVDLLAGQFVFGSRSAAKKLRDSKTNVYRRLKRLEVERCLVLEPGRNFTLVTLCNWQGYQPRAIASGTPSATQSEILSGPPCGTPSGTKQELDNKNSINKKPTRALRFEPADRDFSEWMLATIRKRLPKFKEPKLDTWADHVRRAREIDKRTLPELREVFAFADGDSFWQANILSPAKLREKFDTLTAKLKGSAHGNQHASPARIHGTERKPLKILSNTPTGAGAPALAHESRS